MKMNIIKWLVIILFFPFMSFCSRKSNLEQALELAGENRPELEKVLEHYSKNPADGLKLKAARFLIENMDAYTFTDSPELEAYFRRLDSIFSLNERYDNITKEQDSLLANTKKPDQNDIEWQSDLQHVSAALLIDNIDRAFEAWKSPFAKELSFDDFCEFLLPYKVNSTDYPESWRLGYYNAFYPYIKFMLDDSCLLDSGLIFHSSSIVLNENSFRTLSKDILDTVPDFTVSCWNNLSDSLNRPSHIAVSYSRHSLLLYINGLLKNRRSITLNNKELIRNYIGKSNSDAGSDYLTGTVKDFRIYNRELNYREVCTLAGKSKDSLDKKHEIQQTLWKIRDLFSIKTIYENFLPDGYNPLYLKNLKKGTCDDYTILGAYIFRSLGIPSGIDFVPQWANRSMGHDWNVIYTGNNRLEAYSFSATWDTLGNQIKSQYDKAKAAKIFRQTFAKQLDSPAMQNDKDEDLPSTFQNPCIKDVTDSYLDCMDITVTFTQQPPKDRVFAYLCNFNDHDWIPIFWGKIKGNKAVFTKMGKDIVYLPAYYDQWDITPAADPFILTKEGNIKKLIPDHSETQTLILKRKYRLGTGTKKADLLVGGRFQVANKPDFSDSLTVYTVNDVPELRYNPVNFPLKKPYRYFRYFSAPISRSSRGGMISEIEIYSTGSAKKLSGKIIGNKHCEAGWEVENVFDGDPLTSYECKVGERGWVGLDFGKPVNIAYFRYLPRNDDNFIKEGEEYELFYWENNQWNSLGKQTGTSKQYLEYTNAPLNALFWLRDLTKGKEERIFTYENGEQVWW